MTPTPPAALWDRVDATAGVDRSAEVGGLEWVRVLPQCLPAMGAVAQACDGPPPSTHRVLVQGSRCTTVKEFMRTLGDALEFPWYFGQNLDAFHECFRDLLDLSEGGMGSAYCDRPGRGAHRLVLEVFDSERVLSESDDVDLRRFLETVDLDLRALVRPHAVFLMVLYAKDPAGLAEQVRR